MLKNKLHKKKKVSKILNLNLQLKKNFLSWELHGNENSIKIYYLFFRWHLHNYKHYQIECANKAMRRFALYTRFTPGIQTCLTVPYFRLLNFLSKETYKKRKTYQVTVRFAINNIFCTLRNMKGKTLVSISTGTEKIWASKKNLRYVTKKMLSNFLKKMRKVFKKRKVKYFYLILNLSVPKKSTKYIQIKFLGNTFLRSKIRGLVLNIKEKLCYNGCRAKKRQRKKRIRRVFYKY